MIVRDKFRSIVRKAYIVPSRVREHVVQGFGLGDIFGSFADDDCELHLVVGKMLLYRLDVLGDGDRNFWADQGVYRLVEEHRISVRGGMKR